ncbi:hypothetical protein CDAR_96071 [Caerostris darwini]|uniref:Uncharacterized protein n=1 Tax=Caerostris darwini TaxID=1538125 RepID=A0AAV4WJJ1_9ARAC|nr:hypothetical protein CDAR_96071 [Caerostris darwini]
MSLTISQRHYRFETRPFDNHPKPRSPLKSPNSIIIAVHRNCNRNPSFARPSDGHRSKSPLRARYPQSHYPTSIRLVIVRTGLFKHGLSEIQIHESLDSVRMALGAKMAF